jgi:hypothetical protein
MNSDAFQLLVQAVGQSGFYKTKTIRRPAIHHQVKGIKSNYSACSSSTSRSVAITSKRLYTKGTYKAQFPMPPESSPGESHPQALAEPYVRLSPHTAPSVQPPRHPDDLAFRPRLLLRRVGPVRAKAEPPAPLRSSSITEPSALLRTLLPLCPASVLWLLWCPPLELLPSHRDDRFSCSSSKPDSCSRRLYAGRRWGTPQVPRMGAPTSSRSQHHAAVLTPVRSFRHVINGSFAFDSTNLT